MKGERLEVTFLDVGWGDSILVEADDGTDAATFALVDSNDTVNYPSSRIFLKRFFERRGLTPLPYPLFEHVFATHAHTDHINGLQGVLRSFGAKTLYASRCNQTTNAVFANLIRWANRATRNYQKVIQAHTYLSQNQTVYLGPVRIDVLWPPSLNQNVWDAHDENNNSLVLALTLKQVCFLLTGDCVAANWVPTNPDHVPLPKGLRLIQHPHHGARNGLFDGANNTPMLDSVLAFRAKHKIDVLAAVSCHPRPHHHPHSDVIAELDTRSVRYYRTDQCYHTTFRTDGTNVDVRYSRY